MDGNDPDFGQQGKRPWFGPRRFGYGSRPQTWQGFLLVGLTIALLIVIATITRRHSPLILIGILPLAGLAIFAQTRGRR